MAFNAKQANYNALRKLSIRERLAAASDRTMGQMMIEMLSPTQVAELFPRYWVERNPNISGFLKALPSSLSGTRQRAYEEQINNTTSGSAAGANFEAGGYRRKYQQEIDAERQRSQITKRGAAPLPQLSPEQRAAFEAVKAGDIDVNDERVKFLQNISDSDLARAGLQKIKDQKGDARYHYQPPQVSDEDVKRSMASGGSMKQIIDRAASKAGIDPRIMYGIVNGESRGKTTGEYDIGDNRLSFGPFQLFTGGGLGNDFQRDTGLDPRNSSTIPQQADWIAKEIAKRGDAARKWVASKWYGYGTQQLGQPGTRSNINERAAIGDASWNSNWFKTGIYTKMGPSDDAITQNYTPQQLEIKKRELLSQIEAGRITELAQITQPGMRAAAQELNITSTGDMKQVKAQLAQSSGGFYHSTVTTVSATRQECADLSKAFNPNVGPAAGWKVERNDGGIRPGVVVATNRYNDGSGGKHAQGYHTGVAMSGVRPDGTFLLLEQANGMKPKISVMKVENYNYDGRHPEIQGNYWAPIKGHEKEQSIEALKIGYQLASDENKASIQAALGGVSDNNVVTSQPGRVEKTVGGYPNSEQISQTAGVGLSEKAQVERKAVVQGTVSFEGGGSYHFGSGRPDDPNYPSTPLGSSEVGGLNPHRVPGGVGYEMPSLQGWDPKVGRNRSGMVIHSSGHDDLKQLYSHGCISIPQSEFGAFEAEMENFKKAHGGKAYINVMPDGRVTVTASPAYDKAGNYITPISPERAVKEIQTNQPQVVQNAPQVVSGDVKPQDDIKPLEKITQPQGPINAAGPTAQTQASPAPTETAVAEPGPKPSAAVEQPKPTAPSGTKFTFNKKDYLNEIARAHPMIDSPFASALGQDRNYAWNETVKGLREAEAAGVLTYDEKSGSLNIKDMNHPRVQQILKDMKDNQLNQDAFLKKAEEQKQTADNKPATQVKAMADGGTVPVNTDKIAAYPIGGLRGDNAVVVNAQQKPLFTMNTNKEDVFLDSESKKASVMPDKKGTNIPFAPQSSAPSTGMMEQFQSTVAEIKQDFANLKAAKIEPPDMTAKSPTVNESGWISKFEPNIVEPFKSPSVRRVAYRSGGMETGEPNNNFHYSRCNNS